MLHDFTDNRYASEGALTYQGAASGLPYDGTSPLYGPSAIGGDSAHGTIFSLTPKGDGWAYRTIFSFCKGGSCRDGWAPFDTLTMDGSGNLYGVTAAGGTRRNQGVVFKLTPSAKGYWDQAVLYEFCKRSKCSDGAQPISNSIALGENGEIFGTTLGGGGGGPVCCGVAYKLVAGGGQTVLYRFCAVNVCGDGREPSGGLVADASGRYLGVSLYGGGTFDPRHVGGGTIFALGDKFRELYAFCAEDECPEGAYPAGPLVGDGAGHYYGVTHQGGAHGYGTIYEFTP